MKRAYIFTYNGGQRTKVVVAKDKSSAIIEFINSLSKGDVEAMYDIAISPSYELLEE